MLAVLFLSWALLSSMVSLVMWMLDMKHVVAKRVSFILGGIEDQVVFTLYLVTLLATWSSLLRDAADGDGHWGSTHQLLRRIFSSLVAWGVIHTVSKGIARYMEVYFQREAYFNPIMKALAEEFVIVTLLAMCSVDMRQWLQEHSGESAEVAGPSTERESDKGRSPYLGKAWGRAYTRPPFSST